MSKALYAVKWDKLNKWDRTKRVPQHARWMHNGSAVDVRWAAVRVPSPRTRR